MTIENIHDLENEHAEAVKAAQNHFDRIAAHEARLKEIGAEIAELEISLITEALAGKPLWPAAATAKAALEIERETLPGVIARLKEKTPEFERDTRLLAARISEAQSANEDGKRARLIRERLNNGGRHEIIRSDLKITKIEYDRLCKIAKTLP